MAAADLNNRFSLLRSGDVEGEEDPIDEGESTTSSSSTSSSSSSSATQQKKKKKKNKGKQAALQLRSIIQDLMSYYRCSLMSMFMYVHQYLMHDCG